MRKLYNNIMKKRIELGCEHFLRDRKYLADDGIVYSINEDSQSVMVYQSDYRVTEAIIASEVVIEGKVYPVNSIWKCAFYECLYLSHVEILDSVTEIGEGAFELCRSLNSIKIPNLVTKISNCAVPGKTFPRKSCLTRSKYKRKDSFVYMATPKRSITVSY